MRFTSHADRIIAAAVQHVFTLDLTAVRPGHLEALLSGYAGALNAIGAKL